MGDIENAFYGMGVPDRLGEYVALRPVQRSLLVACGAPSDALSMTAVVVMHANDLLVCRAPRCQGRLAKLLEGRFGKLKIQEPPLLYLDMQRRHGFP